MIFAELVTLVLIILLQSSKAINGKKPQAAVTLIKEQNVCNVAMGQS